MYSMILLGAVALILLVNAGWSALRGLARSRIRFITVLVSAAAAVITCLVVKAKLPNAEGLVQLLESNTWLIEQLGEWFGSGVVEGIEMVLEYAAISPTVIELAVQLSGAMLLPVICLVLFLVFSLLTWVIYTIISLICRHSMKEYNRSASMSRLRAAGLGLAQGLVAVIVLLLPISGYLAVAEPTMNELAKQEIVDKNDPTMQTVQEIMGEINDSPVLTVYRVAGGNVLTDSMMKMEVAGMEVKLEEELDSMLVLVQHITDLGKTELSAYGENEANIIRSIGDSFNDSKLLAPIMGDILYAATDAWMNGEEFLGVAKPDMGESAALFDPFMDALLEIIHEDAKTAVLLQADVKTLAEMVATLAQHGVFANMNNTEELLTTLGGEGVVKSLVTTLGTNNSMKRLIPEVTNLGVRAIGQTLNIPQDVDAVYGAFMDDVAGALNEVSDLSEAERVAALSERLNTAFDEAGVAIDDELIDFYSTSMVHDMIENNPNEEVTSADVQAFFLLYAERVVENTDTVSASKNNTEALGATYPLEETDPFAGTVYGDMTPEERANSAAAVLANICTELSKLDAEDESFAEQAKTIVTDAFTGLLGEEHAALETVKNVEVTKPVSTESIQNTANMQSSEKMKETTTVITVEDLLVNSKEAAEKINAETVEAEANAIAAIFNTASDLVGSMTGGNQGGEGEGESGMGDISQIATSVGTILDSLNQTGSFGEEKTANLFTAVLQSSTVRDAAGLDMETATQMANKATEGGGSYAETMGTVAGSVNIMESLTKDGEITEEELVELIETLTPQTAGMIEVYVTDVRLQEFGMPVEYAGTTANLISSLFSYMAKEDLKDYNAEAKALNQILQIALAAEDSESDRLFSSAPGANDGVLPTAKETVEILLGSQAIDYSLIHVLTDGEKVTTFDPYGLGEDLPQDSAEYLECQNAVLEYRDEHPETDDLLYEALAALLGVQISFEN